MAKDPQVFLKDIRDYCQTVANFTQGKSFKDVETDQKTYLALLKALEIIGEACNNLENDFQNSHPEVPWAEIIAFRNHTAHEYWDVDFQIVWRIATIDTPDLHQKILKLIS
jgi:uncharacterized protein with HEPN domain